MPSINIYYFILKHPPTPVVVGSTGTPSRTTPTSDQLREIRLYFKGSFEKILATLFSQCRAHVPNISNPTQNINVEVREIPARSPGIPDFSSVESLIQPWDPIVYIVNPDSSRNPSNPADRRASDVLFDAISHGFEEFSGLSRPSVNTAEGGLATEISSTTATRDPITAPLVAEIYYNAFREYDAQNSYFHQARRLANLAFHEIAHLKAECANRPSQGTHPWSNNAITGSIHDYNRGQDPNAIIRSAIGQPTEIADSDRELMGRHMLCPVPFYQLDQGVAAQCFSRGNPLPPTSTSAP